ncbi:DUF2993 domain-containing protein [Streptomyces sp. NPDC087420]|uniref:LmeA family phospholipid-binding protein n=1 Tax=Streptomyces sp. NPDC087420 TaxID=3365785 RepID=UPI003837D910
MFKVDNVDTAGPRWRRWWLWWRRPRVLVPALAALPLLAAGADFSALRYVEWRTAQAFQEATGATTTPQVRVQGRPFAPQLARGTLDRVDISASVPASADSPVAVSDLDVHMTDLRRNADARTASARSASATAYVTYRDLSDALGVEVAAAPTAGWVVASVDAPLIGEFRVSARVVKGGPASIAFEDVRVESRQLPAAARDLIEGVFRRTVPLRNIPHGLALDRVSSGPSGLTAALSGHDVTFATDGSARAAEGEG